MADAVKRPKTAKFGWDDAMPKSQDDIQMLLAKHARLQFVCQVGNEPRSLSFQACVTGAQPCSYLLQVAAEHNQCYS